MEHDVVFGLGWAALYNQMLDPIDSDNAEVFKGDGLAWLYTDRDAGSGLYFTPRGGRNSLKRLDSPQRWLETRPDGTTLHYQTVYAAGYVRLDRITHLNDAVWTIG